MVDAPRTLLSEIRGKSSAAPAIQSQDIGIIYRAKNNLTQQQIAECEAVFAMAVQTLKGSKPTLDHIAKFWRGVYERWNGLKTPTKPRYKDRQPADSCIKVGVFNRDLPVEKAKKQQEQRMKGCPAYVKVHVGGPARGLGWLWVDSANRTVKQADIDFFEGQPLESFIKAAIVQYDNAERPRLCQWNTQLAIYIVRRRILNWTQNGYPSDVGGENRLMAEFEDIVLCQDLLSIYVALAQQIRSDGNEGGQGSQDNGGERLESSTLPFTVSW